jgi:hypothetical protein
MTKLVFENPTKDQLKHIYNAEAELALAGIIFDSGSDIENNKVTRRNWELDWSLEGAKIIE